MKNDEVCAAYERIRPVGTDECCVAAAVVGCLGSESIWKYHLFLFMCVCYRGFVKVIYSFFKDEEANIIRCFFVVCLFA